MMASPGIPIIRDLFARRAARPHAVMLALLLLLVSDRSYAQVNIPVGTWRLHLSYNRIESIAVGTTEIFAATENGILVYNTSDRSLGSLNTLNGLSSTGISCIGYDDVRGQLLVAYTDGNLDILRGNTIINFNRIRNANTITGSRRINHIAIRNDLAFLSADFGIVVFDLDQIELRETWRDLGREGSLLAVRESVFFGDSIFAATENGVLAGHLGDNLLDFRKWRRYDTGNLNAPVSAIEIFDDRIFAAIDGDGLYEKNNGQWIRSSLPGLQNTDFSSLSAGDGGLLVTAESGVWVLRDDGQADAVTSDLIDSPTDAVRDAEGNLWIGDRENGLLSDLEGTFRSYVPNGPAIDSVFRLKFLGNRLYALAGGFRSGQPLGNKGILSYFENGVWHSVEQPLRDLTDIDQVDGNTFMSSFGGGLEKTDPSGSVIYDESNSPLMGSGPGGDGILISAVEGSADGLWVANPEGASLLRYSVHDGVWHNEWNVFSYITDLRIDHNGNLWMAGDHRFGGGLDFLDPARNASKRFTSNVGSGGLPNSFVNAIEVDRDGNVWVGTEQGIAYFYSPDEDAVRPVFENRFLLQSEKITAIKADGGNRKWIGTDRGVWLFSPAGEELVHNFTVANSPLLSDRIVDIEIDPTTGEVFFATDQGIISYRSDATAGSDGFDALKIFPNPVTSGFSGMVGISGLATDAIVKITDASGKLLWQTRAHGGTASWDLRDQHGKRAARGVYLVFVATETGGESAVGKIAVVE